MIKVNFFTTLEINQRCTNNLNQEKILNLSKNSGVCGVLTLFTPIPPPQFCTSFRKTAASQLQ